MKVFLCCWGCFFLPPGIFRFPGLRHALAIVLCFFCVSGIAVFVLMSDVGVFSFVFAPIVCVEMSAAGLFWLLAMAMPFVWPGLAFLFVSFEREGAGMIIFATGDFSCDFWSK